MELKVIRRLSMCGRKNRSTTKNREKHKLVRYVRNRKMENYL